MWSEQDAEQVRGLLMQFNGAEEVCAVLGCEECDLDGLSMGAFGLDFKSAKEKFAATGRAMLRKELMMQALNGNPKALDMLAREQLGMGPVEQRAKHEDQPKQEAKVTTLDSIRRRKTG
ncbi:MAG: hypothetical protein J6V72_04270 [Kiritimatiellae bacterium]|nr:hypothetical protein [Kiritimatiellia bacterium]